MLTEPARHVLESISDPFYVLDQNLAFVHANEAAARLGEMPPAGLHEAFERVLSTGKPLLIEHHVRETDRWYEASIHPLDDGLAVYTRDVTMRKRAFELTTRLARVTALRADISGCLADERHVPTMLRRMCEALVDQLELATARVWIASETGNTLVLQASAGVPAHVDGEDTSIPVGKDDIGRIASTRKSHTANDGEAGGFAGYPLLVDGRLVGVLAMTSMNTIAEDTFAALEAVADLVAQGLVRRRAEIELEQRLDELARSSAELEQLGHVVSHDLQEPLRTVASHSQLLARRYKGKLDAEADELLGASVEGVTRMQRLINDLLAYSHVGTQANEKTDVDLGALLRVVLLDLETALHDSEAIVTHDALPQVMADEAQMVQLMQNLIGNAIKFKRDGVPPRIHIGVITNGYGHTISVRDNGIGIAPQFFDRIFGIFQRLHPRDAYPGTGIGLAICKKIVEGHGGRIWVESAPERGSTIHFTFPRPQRSQAG